MSSLVPISKLDIDCMAGIPLDPPPHVSLHKEGPAYVHVYRHCIKSGCNSNGELDISTTPAEAYNLYSQESAYSQQSQGLKTKTESTDRGSRSRDSGRQTVRQLIFKVETAR